MFLRNVDDWKSAERTARHFLALTADLYRNVASQPIHMATSAVAADIGGAQLPIHSNDISERRLIGLRAARQAP